MVRVIAGEARGVQLFVPKGNRTRPTGDRVKETLFNILAPRLGGASVLDLFAGSGALGIEALSRGAEHCTFIDRDRSSVVCIRRNLERARLEAKGTILCAGVPLKTGDPLPGAPFSLVFMDPPYEKGHLARTLPWIDGGEWLRHGAAVVVEHSVKEEMPSGLEKLVPVRVKTFNETVLTIFERR